ncbi:GerMN domain-containing protein [Metabacillus iocasae]|uniref:Germination protein M n=1 Tax=Priestia iocasae TaxID=2291674 RepID=A0ABS2QPF0_9BACI|nr:GerMN domain-containing protein [Metabacillus iocasae]MBM7701316.1 germination protein M [Metabacillus iocasae]
MSKKTTITLASTFVATSVFLSGCGLFGGEKVSEEIDPPKDVTYVEDEQALENDPGLSDGKGNEKEEGDQKEEATQTIKRDIYLIDKNGYVVPQSFELPKQEGVAKQVLEHLVQGGPVTNMLPDGFSAPLPADTEVGVNMEKDGTIVADFSKEFKNYKAEDELKILQAITWTLTQFDGVEKVKIRINGHDQKVMPVNNTPIGDGVSRANGINFDSSGVIDITQTKAATLYYVAQNGDDTYYVPVTKRIEAKGQNAYVTIINELIKGPSATSGLVSDFNSDVALLDEPKYEDGNVTLNFNENILGNLEGNKVSQHVVNSLVLSLTEQAGVESVAITVDGKAKLTDHNGKELSAPVTRPKNVNTGSF